MNVKETTVVVVKSASIPLARLNAAATVDISFSEMVDNVERLMSAQREHTTALA